MKPQSPPVFATEAAFGVFLSSVAALLPGKWSSIPNPYPEHYRDDRNGQLRRDDGLTLDTTANGYSSKGKIVVRYCRPRDSKGQYVTVYAGTTADTVPDPSIGCGETKTAEQVARDIEHRLLADAEALHPVVLERIALWDKEARDHLATLQAVAQAAGLPDIPRQHKSTEPRFALHVPDPRNPESYRSLADVEIRQSQCVHFTLDLNAREAVALIAFLRSPAYLAP